MGATDAVLYVANTYNDSVSVIDTTTNTVTTTLAVGSPMAIAVFTPPTPLANGTLCNRNAACDSGYCNTSPPGTANDLCATAICGNGVTEGSEGCDDGNLVDTDFCTATCTPAACGDGILLDLYEECDDGNLLTEECIYGEASCVVCDDACALFAGETDFCGDGILDAAELCDDGNTADGDSCSSTCVCGVGFHLEGGACISDTRSCLPPPTGIATGTQTWSGTSWAICLAATCATGYHLEGGACPRNPVAYVVNGYVVLVMDTITQLVTATIPVGSYPTQVAVNSSGTFAYVTNADSGSVSVIDTATNTVSATVAVGQSPSGIALSPTGSSAYVTNYGHSSISVFNTTSNSVTTNFLIGNSPWRVAVNPAGTLAYVAMRNSPTMPVIDTATNTVTATIPLGTSSGPGESGAVGIALNGAGTLAYALLPAEWFSGPTGMQSRVKVIDTATNTVTATIPVGGMAISEEGSLTVNAAGTRLYVATWESNSVSVIDTATNTVIAEIAVGIQPTALSMGATDALLYVTNREDDAVKVIDTATNTVTATIPVGIHPVAIAVASPPAPLGALCALNGQCASGFCATGPDGNANDRCAPPDMNYLPPATFVMGSPIGEVGRSTIEEQHTVTISRGLYMGQTEVTQAQWKALSGGINPSYFQSTTGTAPSTANANDTGPVEQIDWYSAVAFANAKSAADGLTACYILINCTDPIDGWKDGIHAGCNDATFAGVPCTGYRLPTESESQYAARGGTTTATFGGDLSGDSGCVTVSGAGSVLPGTPLSDLAWYNCNAGGRTHQVAAKVANGFGLYDVLGNAWEWTGDWSGNYPASGVSDPTGPATGTGRVLSGCSWNGTAACTRSAIRGNYGSNDRVWDVGFRLVRTAF
jgi:YVTN family beta-propeller protein/cysteine-rich repeat protein